MATKKAKPKAQISYAFGADAEANAQTIEAMAEAIGNDWPAYLHIHNRMPMPIVLPGCVRGMYLQHVAAPNPGCAGMYFVSNVEKLHKLALEVQSLAKMNKFTAGITMLIGEVEGSEHPSEAEPLIVLFPSYTEASYEIERGQKLVLQSSVTGGQTPYTYTWKLGGAVLTGQASATLTIDDFQAEDQGVYTLTASDSAGSKASNSVSFDMKPLAELALRFTGDAAQGSVQGPYNDMVTLQTSTTGGKAPYSYAWALDGQAIAGQSAQTLVIDALKPKDEGTYTCTATDSYGDSVSASTTVAAIPLDAIGVTFTIPENDKEKVQEGGKYTLQVSATGGLAPYSYAWSLNASSIEGSGASLTLTGVSQKDEGTYTCTVTDNYGGQGQAHVQIEVAQPLAVQVLFDGAPIDDALEAEQGAALTIDLEITGGEPPYSVQWFKNGGAIEGQSAQSLVLADFGAADVGQYWATVKDSEGDQKQSSTFDLSIDGGVEIDVKIIEPTQTTIEYGASVHFEVQIAGHTGSPVYQWFKDGQALPNRTEYAFEIANFGAQDAGVYECEVTDSYGGEGKGSITLQMQQLAALSVQVAGAGEVAYNATHTLSASAAGGLAPYAYQWKKDGGDLAGKTAQSLVLADFGAADVGTYSVQVTDALGSEAISAGAELELEQLAALNVAINGEDYEIDVPEGDKVTVIATPTGGLAPYAYQWEHNGAAIEGKTGQELVIDAFAPEHEGRYRVQVTDALGTSATSRETGFVLEEITPLSVLLQAPSGAIEIGSKVTLKAQISGGKAPFTYLWGHNGEPLDESSDTLVIESFSKEDEGGYAIQVMGSRGGSASDLVSLEAEVVPELEVMITAPGEPVDGGTALDIAAATSGGKAPFSFSWKKDGVELEGGGDGVLKVASFGESDAGVYAVTVTDSVGSTASDEAEILLRELPPVDVVFKEFTLGHIEEVEYGSSQTLTALATGGDDVFSYEWAHDSEVIEGQTGATLTIADFDDSKAGIYQVTVIDSRGERESTFVHFVMEQLDPIEVEFPEFSDDTYSLKSGDALTIVAQGKGGKAPYSYSWSLNGAQLQGQTSNSLQIAEFGEDDAGVYECQISDKWGGAGVADLTLGLSADDEEIQPIEVTFTSHPDMAICQVTEGEPIEIVAKVTGGKAPFIYTWSRGSDVIEGATSPTFKIDAVKPDDTGVYILIVTDGHGGTGVESLLLEVKANEQIAPETPDLSVSVSGIDGATHYVDTGGRVEVVAHVTGGNPPYVIEWLKDLEKTGVTGDTLLIDPATAEDSGVYSSFVSDTKARSASKTFGITVTIEPNGLAQPMASRMLDVQETSTTAAAKKKVTKARAETTPKTTTKRTTK